MDVTPGGVEASAATGIIIGRRRFIHNLKVSVDRPFLHFIVENPTKMILFAGFVTDPRNPNPDPKIPRKEIPREQNPRRLKWRNQNQGRKQTQVLASENVQFPFYKAVSSKVTSIVSNSSLLFH